MVGEEPGLGAAVGEEVGLGAVVDEDFRFLPDFERIGGALLRSAGFGTRLALLPEADGLVPLADFAGSGGGTASGGTCMLGFAGSAGGACRAGSMTKVSAESRDCSGAREASGAVTSSEIVGGSPTTASGESDVDGDFADVRLRLGGAGGAGGTDALGCRRSLRETGATERAGGAAEARLRLDLAGGGGGAAIAWTSMPSTSSGSSAACLFSAAAPAFDFLLDTPRVSSGLGSLGVAFDVCGPLDLADDSADGVFGFEPSDGVWSFDMMNPQPNTELLGICRATPLQEAWFRKRTAGPKVVLPRDRLHLQSARKDLG